MKRFIVDNNKKLSKQSPISKWGEFVKLRNNQLFIVEEGTGEDIIFANGIAASIYTWRKILPKLSKSFHVYAFDFKGTGFSEKPREEYSIDEFSKEILYLMNYYKIDKAVLVGNSLGGEIVLDFAIKYPHKIKALVLIDSAGYQYNKEITALLVKLSRYKIVGKFIKNHASKKFAKKIIQWAMYNDNLINEDMINGYYKPMRKEGAFEAFLSLVKNLSYTEFDYEKVKKISAPTLIIWGKEDKWIPVSDSYKFHRDIKNSRLVILDDCGHAPQEEKPDEVIVLIKKFVQELESR